MSQHSSRLFTSESVTEGHPDKICDAISDSILDALLAKDPRSRVAVETMVTTGQVHVAGEVTTEAYADIPSIVRDRIVEIGFDVPFAGAVNQPWHRDFPSPQETYEELVTEGPRTLSAAIDALRQFIDTAAEVPGWLRHDRQLGRELAALVTDEEQRLRRQLDHLSVVHERVRDTESAISAVYRLLERHRHARRR